MGFLKLAYSGSNFLLMSMCENHQFHIAKSDQLLFGGDYQNIDSISSIDGNACTISYGR